jgi:hypothetical protein
LTSTYFSFRNFILLDILVTTLKFAGHCQLLKQGCLLGETWNYNLLNMKALGKKHGQLTDESQRKNMSSWKKQHADHARW